MIGGWLSGLTRRAGLVGLCSADFIRNSGRLPARSRSIRGRAPRSTFSTAPKRRLMEAHLRAARGEAFDLPRFADSMASMITYAAAPVARFS